MNRNQESQQRRRSPACSIYEEDGKVRVILEMPGVEKSGLEIKRQSLESNT